MNQTTNEPLVSNRKAFHDYEILETFEAGISLQGTEVKSLKNHQGSLQDAYILISKNTPLLKESSITPYSFGNRYNHEEKRERKLLLHKREIEKLRVASEQKGFTLIPLAFYLKRGHIKVKIAIAKGKKTYDKRHALKEREHQRAMDRAMKDRPFKQKS
jgi:SsrA-binding protein